MVRVKPAE